MRVARFLPFSPNHNRGDDSEGDSCRLPTPSFVFALHDAMHAASKAPRRDKTTGPLKNKTRTKKKGTREEKTVMTKTEGERNTNLTKTITEEKTRAQKQMLQNKNITKQRQARSSHRLLRAWSDILFYINFAQN